MDKINIRIFDKDINFLGEVDNFTSLFYVRKWNTYSEFEFHISKNNKELFKRGNIIMLNNDVYRTGVIEYVEDNEEEDKNIIVKGFGLLYFLTQRITVPPVSKAYDVYNTEIENIMYSLVNSNAINPVDKKRNIPFLENSISKNKGEKLSFQTRYKNLEEELYKLSNHSGLGFGIKLDYKNKKFIFEVLEGRNLSYDQVNYSPVIFSKKYDNVIRRNYIESDIGYKNTGYVAGQGEGAERELVIVNDINTGFDRREIFIDARDIEEGESSSLEDRGKIKLSENEQIKTFECEVNSNAYRKDWDLGDIVTITDADLDVVVDYRISEIKETYEDNSFKIETTFGTIVPTLIDKIKQVNDVPIAESTGAAIEGQPGIDGVGLNFNWQGTKLGIKREDEESFEYADLQGPKGDTGATGLKGDKGDVGATGPQGPKGDAGVVGPQGPQGLKGNDGYTPIKGIDYFDGEVGPQGPKGDKGDTGLTGATGDSGATFTPKIDSNGNLSWTNNKGLANPTTVNIKGPQGPTGATGSQGPQGPKGEQGIQGPQGTTPTIKAGTVTTGNAGTSATVIASTSGTTTTFNFTIPRGATGSTGATGPQGPKGDKGDTGATGPQGPKGDKGDTGATGPQGIQGVQGPKGATGPQGPQGPTGATGANGKDGLTTSVTVNGTKYAHNNGNITLPNYPTKLSELTNDIGTGGGTTIITSSSRPTGQSNGRIWIQIL